MCMKSANFRELGILLKLWEADEKTKQKRLSQQNTVSPVLTNTGDLDYQFRLDSENWSPDYFSYLPPWASISFHTAQLRTNKEIKGTHHPILYTPN